MPDQPKKFKPILDGDDAPPKPFVEPKPVQTTTPTVPPIQPVVPVKLEPTPDPKPTVPPQVIKKEKHYTTAITLEDEHITKINIKLPVDYPPKYFKP
jgi:hypothetical protein